MSKSRRPLVRSVAEQSKTENYRGRELNFRSPACPSGSSAVDSFAAAAAGAASDGGGEPTMMDGAVSRFHYRVDSDGDC